MGAVFSAKMNATAVVPGDGDDTKKKTPKKRKAAATTKKKYTRHEIKLMDKYVPSFVFHEKSTQLHRDIAGAHWEKVFNVAAPSKTSQSSQREARQAPPAASSSSSSGSPIMLLYDTFFKYLEEHSPELRPIFRSSMQIRGKVLVHISIGMRTLMASESFADKVIPLTKTHRRFGVKLEHYEPLGRALLHAMHVVSGDRWTPEIENAWKHLFSHTSVILMGAQQKVDAHVAKAAAKPLGPNMRTGSWTAAVGRSKKSAVLPSVSDLVPYFAFHRKVSGRESAFNGNGNFSAARDTEADPRHAVVSSVYTTQQ